MYREVDIKEAVMAALDGKPVFGINAMVPQDTYNLTEQIEALVKDGDRFIIDEPEAALVEEPKPEEPKKSKKAKNKPGPKPKPVDVGKIHALANAGWSQGSIASEMHLSVSTVRKYLTGVELESEEDYE